MKSEKEKIAEKTIELALGSSIIGLPNIFRTEKKFLKLMWILLFAIALGATINEISVTRTFINKLGLPYNNCLKDVKSKDLFDSDLFKYMIQSTNYSYKQTDCLNYCAGKLLFNQLNMTNKIDRWENIVSENRKYDKTMQILYSGILKKGMYETCSDCPEECDSIKYETSHSITKLSTQYEDFKNFSIENLVCFTIYYESLQYTVIDQIAQMNEFDLISNIGGNLGLFIGISFLSFAELIELFIEIIYIIVK
jgi:hypothetical protein